MQTSFSFYTPILAQGKEICISIYILLTKASFMPIRIVAIFTYAVVRKNDLGYNS
ncbi:chloride channel core [Ktedonobacter racemifer DSM 44963]|uniref:Chloride channel core n=1 Tax=Ktedonobacter racemifer DSM 44963 TaxID=485913 RepID=D6THF7_KTERA|nr:chloride channel core [Ktedonobacter racemifer DSM 44963]